MRLPHLGVPHTGGRVAVQWRWGHAILSSPEGETDSLKLRLTQGHVQVTVPFHVSFSKLDKPTP